MRRICNANDCNCCSDRPARYRPACRFRGGADNGMVRKGETMSSLIPGSVISIGGKKMHVEKVIETPGTNLNWPKVEIVGVFLPDGEVEAKKARKGKR
jgi:hypothetical protein